MLIKIYAFTSHVSMEHTFHALSLLPLPCLKKQPENPICTVLPTTYEKYRTMALPRLQFQELPDVLYAQSTVSLLLEYQTSLKCDLAFFEVHVST